MYELTVNLYHIQMLVYAGSVTVVSTENETGVKFYNGLRHWFHTNALEKDINPLLPDMG